MLTPFNDAGFFLVQSVFDLYIFILMLRIMLQWVSADFHNPLFEIIAKLTTPPLKPIRRIIPTIHGIDFAAVVLLLAIEVIKLALLVWIKTNALPDFLGLIILAFAELLNQFINIFFYAVLGMAILSWVSPFAHGPLADVLYRLTEPLLRPLRRIIPLIAGLDITPIIVLIFLKVLIIVIVVPLAEIGQTFMGLNA